MSDQSSPIQATGPSAPAPHPALRGLDALLGAWKLDGRDPGTGSSFSGTVVRRWMPGGHFMTQEMTMDGEERAGTEYIGYDHAQQTLRSMLFSSEGPGPFCPYALEYIWSIDGDALTIWHGVKDSPARFTGTIDRDAGTVHGRWEWPGGGYEATETRCDQPT